MFVSTLKSGLNHLDKLFKTSQAKRGLLGSPASQASGSKEIVCSSPEWLAASSVWRVRVAQVGKVALGTCRAVWAQ